MTGIYYRYSDYLETNLQVGVAGDKVVGLKFTESPEGEENGNEVLDDVFRYLEGEEVDFSEYDIGLTTTGIKRRALERTRKIPRGSTVTYDKLRRSIGGDESETQEVRKAVNSNPVAVILPSHRVVSESGLGGFVGPKEVKRRLLQLEGADI